ncbi:hypothetical protein GCM10022419_014340 [Nonomuraea rosea]|uniref:Uncharacterized protein n=1 Tax=Nonomuraea rosea TaxID=638574 RepID=A0ABP6VIQ9_9ACTN
MDLEAEILDLKLRMQTLEQSTRSDDDDTTTSAGPIPVTDAHRELADELETLSVEVTGLRWQTREYHTSSHSQLLQRLDDLQVGMRHLELRLDQLLKDNNG